MSCGRFVALLTVLYNQIIVMMLLRRALGSSALQMRACFRFAEDDEGPVATGIEDNKKSELTRKFTGEVKIEEKFHSKTSALYDRYMQARERPLICHDGHLMAYEFVIERIPIFSPYKAGNFTSLRNRYAYAKKTGFYVPIPNQLKLDEGDNPFETYDESNDENVVSHQIVISQTEKINYRENSRVWRHVDPTVVDPHSIQTYSSENVFLIVKENGEWKFPYKMVNQRDNHIKMFEYMTAHLFQGVKYPTVYYPHKKPLGIRKVTREGLDKPLRVLTFKGVSSYGIPRFPTSQFEDFAWVPKPLLADYFSDKYFSQSAWAATHNFY